jgi:NAD kinase
MLDTLTSRQLRTATRRAFDRPRLVLVTRKSQLELLLERHGTYGQARFYLDSRGGNIAAAEEAHERFASGYARVQAAIPPDERRVRLDRGDLATFVFAPDDVLIVVGQDGLVPNVAKYLNGQLTIGVNPDPERYDGILCPHPPQALPQLLDWLDTRSTQAFRIQQRAMALVEREDGQRLLALNEVFVGHRSHQSAVYRLRVGDRQERQSSSGLICATGTGSTGWAKSIAHQRQLDLAIGPEDARLAWLVREPFPSVSTDVDLDFGFLDRDAGLDVASEMGEGGVIFADGIETDRLDFVTGQTAHITVARQRFHLVVPAAA